MYVWLSLVPIVAGCAMSAMKEVSFAWSGEIGAWVMSKKHLFVKGSRVLMAVRKAKRRR